MKRNGKRASQRFWRGLTALAASLTALAVALCGAVNSYRPEIDKFLGVSSSRVITPAEDSAIYSYPSDFENTADLIRAIADVAERMSEEGAVLLKNNGALPLKREEKSKISLLGFASYFPVTGGTDCPATPNSGVSADTADFLAALNAKGFSYNPVLAEYYTAAARTPSAARRDPALSAVYTGAAGGMAVLLNAPGQTAARDAEEGGGMENAAFPLREAVGNYGVLLVTLSRDGSGRGGEPSGANPPAADEANPPMDSGANPLALSGEERALLRAAIGAKAEDGKLIVLLNSAAPMEVQELQENAAVDAILQIGFPGGYGFYGICDLLDGAANPSGHLCDTYPVSQARAPAAQNAAPSPWTNAGTFGTPADLSGGALVRAEGIYTGYRYYETRYCDCVMGRGRAINGSSGKWDYNKEVTYPFGFGLSYTTFRQELDSVRVDLDAGTVTAWITVTNTGNTSGKDAAQLYVSLPWTDYDQEHHVEKSAVQLLNYGKTKPLSPGESETLELSCDMRSMASWDSTLIRSDGRRGGYILDAGTYVFSVGNGAHEALNNILTAEGMALEDGMTAEGDETNVRTWELDQFNAAAFASSRSGTPIENRLDDWDANAWLSGGVAWLSRADWVATFPSRYNAPALSEEMRQALGGDLYQIQHGGSSEIFGVETALKLAELKGARDWKDPKWTSLLDQLTLEECMIHTALGGGSLRSIASITSPDVPQSGGYNGIRSDPLGRYASADRNDPCAIDPEDPNRAYSAGVLCGETTVAQTFNKDLAEEFGVVMGNYSLWSNITLWWGVGLTPHRTAWDACQGDSYSEDPLLSAFQGAATVEGAQAYGAIVGAKEIPFQQPRAGNAGGVQSGTAVFMTEQAAREIPLRALRPAVEEAGIGALMTSRVRTGAYSCNAHPTFLKEVVRGEWGFQGILSESPFPDAQGATLKEAILNGVTMSGHSGENSMAAVSAWYPYWTVENIGDDPNLTAALKQAMAWQVCTLANSNAMDGYSSHTYVESVRTWYDTALSAAALSFGLATLLCAAMYAVRRWGDDE